MEKEKVKNKEIITKLWKGSGNNYVLKLPTKEVNQELLKFERTVKLIPKPRQKGYLIKNI